MPKGSPKKRKEFSWLGGGLVTLPRDSQKEMLEKGKLFAPNITNLDLFRPGSIREFTKFVPKGETLLGTGPKSEHLPANTEKSFDVSVMTSLGLAELITSSDTRGAQSLSVGIGYTAGFNAVVIARIYAQVAALPTDILAESYPITLGNLNGSSVLEVLFTFKTIPALPIDDIYIAMEFQFGATPPGCTLNFAADAGDSETFVRNIDNAGWFINAEAGLKYLLQAGDPPVVGLYDARFESPGPVQYYMGATFGQLLAGDPDTVDAGGSWNDPIWTVGNPSRFELWDFSTLGPLLFVADYGLSKLRAWDGVRGPDRSTPQTDADSTMQAGYRSPLTVARSAGIGAWSAVGLVQVVIMTTLRSGGFRATYGFVTILNTTDNVDLTALAIDSIVDEFYFDIDADATQVFCTEPGRGIFYRVPVANLTPAANPVPNSTTSATIKGMSDATLEAEVDLETLTSLPTGYFTQQIDVPSGKYLCSFVNSMFVAGDAANPSSVFVSAQDAANVWSEYGRTYGVRLDIEPEDGEPVTGLHVADRALFVSKPHYMYRIDSTGDSNLPWRVTRVHGTFGTYSHWSMQVIPQGLLFLDDSGPAICFGTYSALAPGADKIINLFDGRIANELDIWWQPLSQRALKFASSALESGFNRVTWTLGTGDAEDVVKNVLLVYDFQQQQFTTRIESSNVLASIGDAFGFQRIWRGDYAGQAFSLSDDQYSLTDVAQVETPWLDFGMPNIFKDGEWLWLWGQKLSFIGPASKWLVQVFVDGTEPKSSDQLPDQTLYFEAGDPQFSAHGIGLRLGARAFRKIKLVITAPNAGMPVCLDGFAIEFTPEGERR